MREGHPGHLRAGRSWGLYQLSLCSETAGFCLNTTAPRGSRMGLAGVWVALSLILPGHLDLEPDKGKGSRRDTGTCDPSVRGPGLAAGV